MDAPLIQQALLIFACDKAKVSSFYQRVLDLTVIESTHSHDLLSGPGYEIFVHTIPESELPSAEPASRPEPRSDTALKPIFSVLDLAQIRVAVDETGGSLLPLERAWKYRGCVVLDGWDPEGNVVQFRQALTSF